MKYKFPKNFYWGASTSAHQIEGGLENNWSKWEKGYAKVASEKNRENRSWIFNNEENYYDACIESNYISGKACDSFHRYKDDVKVLKELGLNSYRFSIAWSRIEPKKGQFSKQGIEYYKNLVKELKKKNIEPFLTCWHWTIPLWLEQEGGMLSRNIDEHWERYITFLVENLGDEVKYWMTINEPMVVSSQSYLMGIWPPCNHNPFQFYNLAYRVLPRLHKIGYECIKKYNSSLQVSIAKQNTVNDPYNRLPWNILAAKLSNLFWNDLFILKTKKYLDYIGLNFYFHNKIKISGIKNPNHFVNDLGWWMMPYSIFDVMMDLKKYDLPIYIMENGLADREDKDREWWLDETFRAMSDALKNGVDLRGYLHWSLLDNFEWAEGFWPKFGLVEIDEKFIPESDFIPDRRIINVLIENLHGEILLLKRDSNNGFFPGFYHILSGKLEKNESFKQGLLREMREETKLESEDIVDLQCVGEDIFTKWKGLSWQTRPYLVVVSNTEIILNDEHSECMWVSPVDVESFQVTEQVLEMCERLS